MIPKRMQSFQKERLPEQTFENRLIKDGGMRFMEFSSLDVDRLARLDIEVDSLGPRLVVCLWDEESDLEVGGYLVVDNLAMGQPSMGGIRMLPDVSPAAIHNLARGMTLKNAAADLPYGGGKSGIMADRLPPEVHTEVVRRFARLIYRYRDIYLPGPDVGTNDADMKTIAIENGLDHALSKPVDMGGNRIDELGAAAGGCIISLQALLEEMPRLRAIHQFAGLHIPDPEDLTVLIQGFGAVGAHAARILKERIPEARVIGVSDYLGYLYNADGLPWEKLFEMWEQHGLVTRRYYNELMDSGAHEPSPVKYSTDPNDLLRESAFCLIPAAPIAHYLDTDTVTNPSMTVDRMGQWAVSIEGANTYSPLAERKAARARMERAVYRQRGVLIATDYLVNSGGVIFAAQEHLIKTPHQLRIPEEMLGDHAAINNWLADHADELSILAEERLAAAEVYREDVIHRNMVELIDLLAADADLLPWEAAKKISVGRIAASESDRTASDIMSPMPTITAGCTTQQAAAEMIESASSILSVVGPDGELEGVLTRWDITRATALGLPDDQPLQEIMIRQVITAAPDDTILECVRKLEHYEISAMPIVEGNAVRGAVFESKSGRQAILAKVVVDATGDGDIYAAAGA